VASVLSLLCVVSVAVKLSDSPIDDMSLQGVAPEKAIKLTINDLVRSRAMDPETGRIRLHWELAAGGMAGGCQVVCLFEIHSTGRYISRAIARTLWKLCRSVGFDPKTLFFTTLHSKIRLQVQGEAAKLEGIKPRGAIHIIRQLGVIGLYKGSSACLLRDIPFSAIYFPAYSHLKKDVFYEGYNGKKLSFAETLAAAAIA